MVGYSLTTPFVKLATRTSEFDAFAVLAIAVTIVCIGVWLNALTSGVFDGKTASDSLKLGALWAYAAGIVLTSAVRSLFKGLSLGPASVVVPIYGMSVLGGALLGVVFLREPLTVSKAPGLCFAAAGIFLITR